MRKMSGRESALSCGLWGQGGEIILTFEHVKIKVFGSKYISESDL